VSVTEERTPPAVRAATEADLEDLLELYAVLDEMQLPWRVFESRPDQRAEAEIRIRAALFDPDARVCVAERAGGIVAMGVGRVGVASLVSDERSLDLTSVVVRPDLRGRGIGRTIVDDLLAFGRSRGVRVVSLRVFAENRDAVAFWTSLGLRPRIVQMVGEIDGS
jgi:ribosomal protein S18 acetylase RimI-like enzyme